MKEFLCKKCGEYHNLDTLLEFPQPEVISKITSGELKQDLRVIAKSAFVINNEYLLLESELLLEILDYEDDFEMLVWVEISNKEFVSKREEFEKFDEVKLLGKLNGYLPFYEGTYDLPVEIMIETAKDELPKIVDIKKENEFRSDFIKGITLEKVQKVLTRLNHE